MVFAPYMTIVTMSCQLLTNYQIQNPNRISFSNLTNLDFNPLQKWQEKEII